MCVMEVNAGQHSSTMAQAMAHNTKTILSDLEMLRLLFKARNDSQENINAIDNANVALQTAYECFLALYAGEVQTVHIAEGTVVGNERVHEHVHVSRIDQGIADDIAKMHRPGMREEAIVDAHRAEKYETRR